MCILSANANNVSKLCNISQSNKLNSIVLNAKIF